MATLDIVVPATRDPWRLIESLKHQSIPADRIFVVSNEVAPIDGVTVIRFDSDEYLYGEKDVVLRRNLGLTHSEAEYVVFLDDDQIAPRNLVESCKRVLASYEVCWGNHRYIDFADYPVSHFLDLSPENGRSREMGVNVEHMWMSAYGGMLAVRRDVMDENDGFDLAYLGKHAGEDQDLGRRLQQYLHQHRIIVHEPPFAWHPTVEMEPRLLGPTNSCGSHQMEWDGRMDRCRNCPKWDIGLDRFARVQIKFDINKVMSWEE